MGNDEAATRLAIAEALLAQAIAMLVRARAPSLKQEELQEIESPLFSAVENEVQKQDTSMRMLALAYGTSLMTKSIPVAAQRAADDRVKH